MSWKRFQAVAEHFISPWCVSSSKKNVWFVESDSQGRRNCRENRSLEEYFLLQSAENDWWCPVKMPHDATNTPVPTRPCPAGQQRASTAPLHPHPRLVCSSPCPSPICKRPSSSPHLQCCAGAAQADLPPLLNWGEKRERRWSPFHIAVK